MTSNTKILKQTIELLTGELKQVGEYRDNAVRCGVELNKQLAAMTAERAIAERQAALLAKLAGDRMDCLVCPLYADGRGCIDDCDSLLAAWSRNQAVKEGGKG
jgi:hypothetical protein